MNRFQIQFDSSLTNACFWVPTEDVADTRESHEDAIATLNQIAQQIERIETQVADKIAAFTEHVASTAIEVARTVIHSDQELVERQVRNFVQQAMDSVASMQTKPGLTISVNPACVETIHDWAKESDATNIQVNPDESIPPGDCRIESGDQGVSASLDTLLQMILDRLLTGDIQTTEVA